MKRWVREQLYGTGGIPADLPQIRVKQSRKERAKIRRNVTHFLLNEEEIFIIGIALNYAIEGTKNPTFKQSCVAMANKLQKTLKA